MVLQFIRKIKNAIAGKSAKTPSSSSPALPKPAKSGITKSATKPKPKSGKQPSRTGGAHAPRRDSADQKKRNRPHSKKHSERRLEDEPLHIQRPREPKTEWDPAQYQVPPVDNKTRFLDLDLSDELMHALSDLNFRYCTPIQEKSLPHALNGKNVCGRAQTGTGKTAAFLLTLFSALLKREKPIGIQHGQPRALILAPTRELCLQIANDAEKLGKYTSLRVLAVYGGMDLQQQRRILQTKTVDIVVATPGRLLDFYQRQDLSLSKLELLVIDEADRMLDMGFIPDVRRIVYSCPPKEQRQTLLFSATLTPEVTRLASQWMDDAVTIDIEPEQVAADTIDQRVYIVTEDQKFTIVYNILQALKPARVIIFGNRRDSTELLCENLNHQGIHSALLSGAVEQRKRIHVLENFRDGNVPVLVATDVAGRGLHIDGIDLIINFNVPEQAEDYVHRIGRTGRVGQKGISITFADELDSYYIPAIEEYMKQPLKCVQPPEEWLSPLPKDMLEKRKPKHFSHGNTRPNSSSRKRPPRGRSR